MASYKAVTKLPFRGAEWRIALKIGLHSRERDLEQARSSQAEGRHEWACFAAQQAADKAAKALHLSLGQEARLFVKWYTEPFEK
jgi:HEPN domain-containing protein